MHAGSCDKVSMRMYTQSHLSLHLAIVGSREGATIVLELDDTLGRLAGHVVNSVLITEPIRTLDGIVHVPSPVILVHVTERSIDTTLRGNGVGTRREQLRDTSGVEAGLGQTECGAETRATSTDYQSIVLVVYHRVLVAKKWRSLLGAKRLIREDLGDRPGGGEGAGLRTKGSGEL